MERLDEKRVFFLVCALLAFMTGAYILLVHFPFREEAAEIRHETDLVSKEVIGIENFTNKHINLKEYAEDVSKRHERAERALPGELEQSAVIGMLQRNALQHQIQLVSVSPGQIKRESSLLVLPIQIKLKCDYFQLLDFLQSLQEEDRFMKLDQLCVRTVDNRLSFEIEAAVYAMEDSGQAE